MSNIDFHAQKWHNIDLFKSRINHASTGHLSSLFVPIPSDWLSRGAALGIEVAESLTQGKCLLESPSTWSRERQPHPDCMSVDFAVVRNSSSGLDFKLVEAQAYASMYHTMLSLEGNSFFSTPPTLFGRTLHERKRVIKSHITCGLPKERVVMLAQKADELPTFHDFVCAMDDVTTVNLSEIYNHNNQWWYPGPSGPVSILRIYNRVIYSKLHGDEKELMDRLLLDHQISWYNHPAWFDKINKKSLLYLQHHTNPKTVPARKPWPSDLSKWVLKNPSAHSGKGIIISPSIDSMEQSDPDIDFLQEKINYAQCVSVDTLTEKICMEIRYLLSYDQSNHKWIPITNLIRLSYHGMISESMTRCWPGEGVTTGISLPIGFNIV